MYKRPEKVKEYAKLWYQKNRKRILATRTSNEYKEVNRPKRKLWYHKKRTERLEYSRKYDKEIMSNRRDENRLKVLFHYSEGSMKCACCKESNSGFLTIDHINNDGADQRKINKKAGGTLYAWLIKQNFPNLGLQILCYNCNIGRQMNRKEKFKCPHKN